VREAAALGVDIFKLLTLIPGMLLGIVQVKHTSKECSEQFPMK